jgi:hypothetical protein
LVHKSTDPDLMILGEENFKIPVFPKAIIKES